MICVRYEREGFRLTVKGHAKAAPPGQDLICAAVSTIWNTTERALNGTPDRILRLRPTVTIGDGYRSVECCPRHEAISECALILRIAAEGLQLLAESFPEYVCYREA